MAEGAPSPRIANGVAGILGNLSSLPAQFLALCAINVLFLGGVLWFLDRMNTAELQAEEKIFERCITGALAEPRPH